MPDFKTKFYKAIEEAVVSPEEASQEFGEEVKLLEIELAELQYDKHQQDKIDIGEPNVNNENEVS